MNKENIVPAVAKTLELLDSLGRSERGATQAELMKELNITMSTCYRIIQTLHKYDWIRKLPGNRYDISGGLLSAAMKLSDSTARFKAAQPALEHLAAQVGLSAKLSIRQGSEQITILRAESPKPLSVYGRVGSRFPIVEGSVGAALLSAVAPDDIVRLAAECRDKIPEKANPEIIMDRILDIHHQGYCFNARHSRWKVDAMSIPVADTDGQVIAAITLLGFDDDFQKIKLDELAAHLRRVAVECAKLI
ncbi:MAG: IclR family transcriptional regulator [Lentisphaerota bacterium]